MKNILLLSLLLSSCSPIYATLPAPEQATPPPPPPKFHFRDKVTFNHEFYGNCKTMVLNHPLFTEGCPTKTMHARSYVYFFTEVKCGGALVDNEKLFNICESELSRQK